MRYIVELYQKQTCQTRCKLACIMNNEEVDIIIVPLPCDSIIDSVAILCKKMNIIIN